MNKDKILKSVWPSKTHPNRKPKSIDMIRAEEGIASNWNNICHFLAIDQHLLKGLLSAHAKTLIGHLYI